MTLQSFASELKAALIARGLNENEALRSVSNIIGNLSDENRQSLSQYNSGNVEKIADRIALLAESGNVKSEKIQPETFPENFDGFENTEFPYNHDEIDEDELIFIQKKARQQSEKNANGSYLNQNFSQNDNSLHIKNNAFIKNEPADIMSKNNESLKMRNVSVKVNSPVSSDTARITAVHKQNRNIQSQNTAIFSRNDSSPTMRIPASREKENDFIPEEYGSIREKTVLTPEGKKTFIGRVALLSPLIAVGSALFFGGFGIVTAVLGIICAAFFVLFISEVIAGCIISLFSLIYGIVKLFSSIPIGIYEIGLSFIIAGVFLALSVLTYKLAVHGVPFVIRHFCSSMKNTLGRMSEAADDFKRKCNTK